MDFSFNNFNHFLYNMLPQVVGHPLLPTIIKIFTHINHVHIVSMLIMRKTIVQICELCSMTYVTN
jgi:hypothetical protein